MPRNFNIFSKDSYITISSLLVIMISVVIILGWHLDNEFMKSFHPAHISTKYNSAVAFILISGGILIFYLFGKSSIGRSISTLFITLVLAFTSLILLKNFFTFPFNVDDFLFDSGGEGRMALFGSVNFILLTSALLLIIGGRYLKTANILAIIAALLSLFTFIGYFYDEEVILDLTIYTPMSFPSAFNFIMLSIAVIFLKPSLSFLEAANHDTGGGLLLRRMLPLGFILPVVIGWLRWQGEILHILEAELGLTIITFSITILLLSFLIYSAEKIHLRELEKLKYQKQLKKLNEELEFIIKERTEELSVANQNLKNTLADKEMLFKEIHHRVKNNLQLISSILNLEINKIKDDKSKNIMKDLQSRIKSMSIIHEHLYRTKNIISLELKAYVNDLLQAIISSSKTHLVHISTEINVDDIELNSHTAIYIGLIINELFTNSLKHAFKDAEIGKIKIECSRENGKYKLIVADNGKGMPEDFTPENSTSLGLKIVDSLVDQLDGELIIENNNGAVFIMLFDVKIFEDYSNHII
jgi:two-component sensor histidine kinase